MLAAAQANSPAPNRAINDADVIALPGQVHPLAKPQFDAGLADPGDRMERIVLMLSLRPGAEVDLNYLIQQQHDPHSALYHQWLTPDQFGAAFGMSVADLNTIVWWLEQQGFTIDEVARGRRWINFSGSVGQVERAFHAEMHQYLVDGELHHANATPPAIPRALGDLIVGFASLHDFRKKPSHGPVTAVAPDWTTGSSHYLGPGDFATIYNSNPLYSRTPAIDGTGQTVAVVARTNINHSDPTTFRSFFKLPAKSPNYILNGSDPGLVGGSLSGEVTEANLDVQWSGAIAYNATVDMVISASTEGTDGVDLSAQYIVNNNLAPIMTTSFGLCEQYLGSDNTFYANLWAQAASQGITPFVSSGDSGAAGCELGSSTTGTVRAVNGLCSPPNSVCVGGTQFMDASNPGLYWSSTNSSATNSSALSYIPEQVWNESGVVAGGFGLWSSSGGASTVYSKPIWQVAPGVPADSVRDVPDVSLSAAGHDGYLIFQGGQLYAVGGTSAASPSFASLLALVIQQQGGTRQGNANTVFYPLANNQFAGSGAPAVFHDVTAASNTVPGVTGYDAVTGFDLATGLGSVNVTNLALNWGIPDFSVSSGSGSVTVTEGASINVNINTAVTNGFSTPLTLSASGLPGGVTASFNPNPIPAPGSGTSVLTLTVSGSAAGGTVTVTVTASGEGISHTTTFSLTVTPIPVTVIDRSGWRVLYVDSQETGCINEPATSAIDGNPASMWHTEWCKSAPPTPHEIQIDLGANYIINGFQYLPRQDQYSNGNIANYEFYVGTDGANWGTPVSTGTLITSVSDKTQKQVTFTGVTGRYVRLRALTEVSGGPWTSVAELNVLGSAVAASGPQVRNLTLSPASIAGGGATSAATVTLTSAPLTDTTVTLASSKTAAATVPATVIVSAGRTSANFTVSSALSVSTTALVVIGSSLNASTAAALLTVTPSDSSVASIPHSAWRILYVDSQETTCSDTAATNAIDGNPSTMWNTAWCTSAPSTPHEIQIDLGASYTISGFQYLPRQDPYFNGDIRDYEFYVSADGSNWGNPVATGMLITSSQDKLLRQVVFAGVVGRYVRLRALTEVNGGPWTTVAELNILGSAVATSGTQVRSLTLSPAAIAGGGTTSTATVTLTSAPLTSATLTLASSNAAATVPATVIVSAGTTTANFTVTSASTVSANVLSVINASYNGSIAAALLTVTPGTSSAPTVPRSGWRVLYVDSQETGCVNEPATNAIDGLPGTMWHTEWCTNAPPTPHEIQIDLGTSYSINGFQYLPRQDPYFNGNIRDYEFYVSGDGVNWGNPVAIGTLITSSQDKALKEVRFAEVGGHYVRLRAISEVNGKPWTNAAEINVLGTLSRVPRAGWRLLYVDSQETGCTKDAATNAFDGNPATMWHTAWCNSAPATPHEIQIDLGALYSINGFQYLPRQDQYFNGDVRNYEFYVSADGANWGTPVSSGTLITNSSDHSLKQVTFAGVNGRYVRFRALSEVNGGPWTSMAELYVLGSVATASGPQIASVMLIPASIAAGGHGTASVTLTRAPLTDVSLTLTSSNPDAATVPAAVTVYAGTTTASFTVTSAAVVSTTVTSVITATLNGSGGTATLTVTPASLANIPHGGWRVLYVDSQETGCINEPATNAIDGNPATMWHTEWCKSAPATPHEIQIDLGAIYSINGFQYLPRQDSFSNGDIANYEFYVSADGVNWGPAVASGTLITSASDHAQKQVTFTGTPGRFVRLRALTEISGGPWTAVAELNVLGSSLWSNILAPGRAIDWSNAGVAGGIPNRTTICAAIDPYDGPADPINNALQNCPERQVVLLNAGTYNLSSGIDFGPGKSRVTLRGAGADQTFLMFSGEGAMCHGFFGDICMEGVGTNWRGGPENSATWTAADYARGQTQITMSNASNLRLGSLLILDQCNDGLSGSPCTGTEADTGNIWVCDSVAAQCNDDGPDGGPSGSQRDGRDQQQIVTVTGISGNLVTFSPGLYMPNWTPARTPGAWWASGPVAGDGVEDLSMEHTLSTAATGVSIVDCDGCWVKGVRSVESPYRSHVWIIQSPHAVVRDSYFYGTKYAASQSYGVEIFPSSDALIENNIFQRIASPQMINGACSGCVVAYNHSINDYYAASPNYMSPSASLHAGGIDNILLEGNIGAGFRADLYHGSHNFATLFRNRFSGFEPDKTNGLYPVFLDPFSRYFNVIGNVLGNSGTQVGYQNDYQSDPSGGYVIPIYILGAGTVNVALSGDPLTVSTMMRWGNYDTVHASNQFNSSEVPTGGSYPTAVPSSQTLPASFYLVAKPAWFGSVAWPPIGPDVTGGNIDNVAGHAYKIPAQLCWENANAAGQPADGSGTPVSFNASNCYGAAGN